MQNDPTGEETAPAEATTEEVKQEESATSEPPEKEESETEQPSDEGTDTEKPNRKPGAEKRIAQLTWQLKEQERRFQELESKLNQPKPAETPTEKPTLESVGYDEGKYAAAMEEYLSNQIDTKLDSRLTAKQQETAQRQAQETLAKQTSEFFKKGIEIADDFAETISDESLPVTDAMRDALFAIDKGPEVLYHLANNRAEINRIAELPPYAQAVEIGRLEARMAIPGPKSNSSAPSPIKPLSAGGESVQKDPDKMTMKEYVAWREKQRKG